MTGSNRGGKGGLPKKPYERPRLRQVTLETFSPKIRKELLGLLRETRTGSASEDLDEPTFFLVLNLEGTFVQVSDDVCSLLGYAHSDLVGKPIEFVTAPNTSNVPKHLGAVLHFGWFQGLWMFVNRQGMPVMVSCVWELLADMGIGVRLRRLES